MKKSVICLFLSLSLLLSCLCGCDLSSLEEYLPDTNIVNIGINSTTEAPIAPTQPVETVFESYEAVITQDNLALRKQADPTAEILGTVSTGDTLHVLQIIDVNGISWASTDRGWIYAEHVQASSQIPLEEQPQLPTEAPIETPTNDGTNAEVIVSTADIHATANPTSSVRGSLESGDRVTISQFTHYADTAMVYVGNGWIKLSDILFDSCSLSGAIPCIVTYDDMNVRSGPSTNYRSVGKARAGTEIMICGLMNSDMLGKPWAVTFENKWYFLEYLLLPQGIVHVEGDNAYHPFPPKDSEG